ncbi:hypothetical protein DFH07DRAFT_1029824 [Mycena maculata]|uniref:Anaphase-promoting complex subunit 1 n=1 Tax=Mycena maculata TaxID=230809 RepID=A0AAD7J073_9AGAR|nr:hypothetical protein DFH07DRAFT_1029824 [Mycena maculata]
MQRCTISVNLFDPVPSADAYLSLISPEAPEHPSDLLTSIRSALRGSGSEPPEARRSTFVSSQPLSPKRDPWEEEEITWNSSTVVWSAGGVLRKKWTFTQEGQQVQSATLGWLEQNSSEINVPQPAHYTSNPAPTRPSTSERPTFGPFARHQQNRKPPRNKIIRVPAVFVFLRSIGKIFLKNGLDYTFAIPFVVRKAWPLYPHGVMIQRSIEPIEREEAALTGEALLPTIFSFTSPFSEAGTVGLTTGIVGGFMSAPSLKDEDENTKKPLKAVPSTESVVWVSHRGPGGNNDLLVTVDADKRQLSVWRYVYIKPKDTPVPLGRARTQTLARHRQSMSTATNRRTSTMFSDLDRLNPRSPKFGSRDLNPVPDIPVLPGDMPPLSALPGMAPALSTATTMASIGSGTSSQWSGSTRPRRNSLTRNELSVTMDRMVLGGKPDADGALASIEHGRMKASYWMEKLHSQELSSVDSDNWRGITCSLFDGRWAATSERALLSIHFPATRSLLLFSVHEGPDNGLKIKYHSQLPALGAVSLRITRRTVWDLLVLKPDHELVVLTHGHREIPIALRVSKSHAAAMDMDVNLSQPVSGGPGQLVGLKNDSFHSATLIFENDAQRRRQQAVCIDMVPSDYLTSQTLRILALALSEDIFFQLHRGFLEEWSTRGFRTSDNTEFECLTSALCRTFELPHLPDSPSDSDLWSSLGRSASYDRFREDPALRALHRPPPFFHTIASEPSLRTPERQVLLAPILYALHTLAEDLRLRIDHYQPLTRLAPVICTVALEIRPEWADYWKRLCPDAMAGWPHPTTKDHQVDDRLPVWPPDVSAILYGRISNPDWQVPWHDTQHMAGRFHISPSFAFGRIDPLTTLTKLTAIYKCLADAAEPSSQKRAENAILRMVELHIGPEFLNRLPLGVLSPIREAARTCQLAPPSDWPLEAYRAVGRNDIAASASQAPDMLFGDGYKAVKDFVDPSVPRSTIEEIVAEAKIAGAGDVQTVSGVELELDDFTDIRFGQDRRLEEVARMLCSSNIAPVRVMERPELNEHDQAKEHQLQVLRIAERTLALPYGRAMFTFGSLPTVTREAYTIPKLEFAIRLQPLNLTVSPETGKIHAESQAWGDFHNGVAAGLRISPSATGVESSWIAFNKPADLTPEHAGFLFALGLTGHLKEMLTWHTFAYLTPKHDLTSIGVLLGLSAANIGTGDQHVTKLLAVHTPALLPTPTVDLNVPLMTQAAGIAGVGLLYMGTKNRRMAEVCLSQISRPDLVQPDLSNEYREAYTFSSALSFGMIMLGKGSMIPADMVLLSRLNVLIHGEAKSVVSKKGNSFDLNLTSPAATLALGLMYLRTERKDVADMLTIPDTVLALNRIQPSFLLMRVLARALIMWDAVAPTSDWQSAQIPTAIREAVENRTKHGKPLDDALELAYYNILASSCFVMGLKFAGTARQEAYMMIIRYFDLFTRMVYSNSQAFDHKIRRSAVRDGLNLISISLSMVMAGTGEISCLRRLRFAYGMYHQTMYHPAFKYGIHVATHMSLGLLFLGGGRFTLGTSDAAIACMITAFFPRAHHQSSDNKSFLQALRHLWVLAIEPRCLIARDVETTEVVYLPVKITVRDGNEAGTTQLISPTLIPDLDKLAAIRVDTPRYWPFHFDTANIPRHRESLLRSQTLYVKRRTAFLSYTEDPRGSRSLFVRSRSSTGEAATLDFPQLTDTKVHPAGDLSEFITSFSNDTLFLAFADHMAREEGETDAERLLHTYCHANLLDSILQGKPQTLQSHLTLFRYRMMTPSSRYFQMNLQDLRFAADFYSKIYERRFSGRREHNYRIPLIRDSTVSGALYALDKQLDDLRTKPEFLSALSQYARGERVADEPISPLGPILAWYMLRNSVPVSTLLLILKDLAAEAYTQCLGLPAPGGTDDTDALGQGIKEVLHATGSKLTSALGSGWSVRSLHEILEGWKIS